MLVNEYKPEFYVNCDGPKRFLKNAKFGKGLYLRECAVLLCYEQNRCAEQTLHHL